MYTSKKATCTATLKATVVDLEPRVSVAPEVDFAQVHLLTATHPTAAFTATSRWHTASCTATPLQPPKAAAKLTASHTTSHTRFGVTVRGHNSGPPSQAFKFS